MVAMILVMLETYHTDNGEIHKYDSDNGDDEIVTYQKYTNVSDKDDESVTVTYQRYTIMTVTMLMMRQ